MDDEARSASDRYARQIRFAPIGEEGQQRLQGASVALLGCGGLGTVLADILVRAGIGQLRLADRDFVEESNLQRQVLFDAEDVAANLPKAEAARRKLTRINSSVTVEALVADIDAGNIRSFADGADVLLDGTDNFETRYLVNDLAIATERPWVYGAAVGSYGMAMAIAPGRTPCLRCLWPEAPAPGAAETCDTAGVLASVVHVVASIQAAQVMKLVCLGLGAVDSSMVHVDVWAGTYRSMALDRARRTDCDACGRHHFRYLDAERGSFVTTLCGRNAVQLSWREEHAVDLLRLARALEPQGEVAVNRFLLKFRGADAAFTLFPDGRAIIEGTADPAEARAVYARFIG